MKLRLFNGIITSLGYKSSITQEIQIIFNIINNEPSFPKKREEREDSFLLLDNKLPKTQWKFLKNGIKNLKEKLHTHHLKVNILDTLI